jgi:hypothetical protein
VLNKCLQQLDLNSIRAFTQHGQILVKPITQENLVNFAKKVEPNLIIFLGCKTGNQILSMIRRFLSPSNKKTTASI